MAERLRWLRAYAPVVQQVLEAVHTHRQDVEEAAAYFAQVADGLARQVVGSSKFRIAVMRSDEVRAEAAEHREVLLRALSDRFGHDRLAGRCVLAPEPLKALQHPLNTRLDGLDEAVTAAPLSLPGFVKVMGDQAGGMVIRVDIVETLEEGGHTVVGEAGDGEQAIRLARELAPDLVVAPSAGWQGVRRTPLELETRTEAPPE